MFWQVAKRGRADAGSGKANVNQGAQAYVLGMLVYACRSVLGMTSRSSGSISSMRGNASITYLSWS